MVAGYFIVQNITLDWSNDAGKYNSIGGITDDQLKKIEHITTPAMFKIIEEKMADPTKNTSAFFNKLFVVKSGPNKVVSNSAKSVLITFIYALRMNAN